MTLQISTQRWKFHYEPAVTLKPISAKVLNRHVVFAVQNAYARDHVISGGGCVRRKSGGQARALS